MSLRIFRPAALGAGARIASIASFLPERVVSNAELVAMGAPLGEAEMVQLSGIRERRWVAKGVATSDLAIAACRRALARAGITNSLHANEIDRLILATVSPDHSSPSAACIVQKALELGDAPAFDVTASCSGFLYALELAMRSVCTGDRAALACAADVRSLFLDIGDRATCALFGDGAGACVVRPCAPGAGLLAIGLLADGSGAKSVYVPAGGSRRPATRETVDAREHTIRMEEGPQVYLAAVEGMLATAEGLLSALGLSFADIALVVPHQPNKRILDRLLRLSRLPEEKMFFNVEKVGNVSGATCAIALDAAFSQGRVRAGDKLLLLAAGAGYTAGAALLLVDDELLATYRDVSQSIATHRA